MLVTSSKISSEETWLGLYCKLGVWAKAEGLCTRPRCKCECSSVNESAESQRRCAEI